MRQVDAMLEPFQRRQAKAPAYVSRVRVVPSRETDLWLEPARAYELADGREARVHLAALDSRHGVLGDAGAFAQVGLGQGRPGACEIDEIAAVHIIENSTKMCYDGCHAALSAAARRSNGALSGRKANVRLRSNLPTGS